jgi:hypothetical protein
LITLGGKTEHDTVSNVHVDICESETSIVVFIIIIATVVAVAVVVVAVVVVAVVVAVVVGVWADDDDVETCINVKYAIA